MLNTQSINTYTAASGSSATRPEPANKRDQGSSYWAIEQQKIELLQKRLGIDEKAAEEKFEFRKNLLTQQQHQLKLDKEIFELRLETFKKFDTISNLLLNLVELKKN